MAWQIVQGVVAFAFVAIAVRTLGTRNYGLFRQVSQMLAIAAQLGIAGFNYSAMRFIAKARASGHPGEVRGSAWTAIVGAGFTSALVFAALLLAAGPLAARFADTASQRDDLAGLIRLGAAFVPLFSLTQVLRYCTQAYKTLVPSVVVGNIVQPLARLIVASGLIVAGFGVGGALVGTVVASAVALVLAFVLFRRILTPIERTTPARAKPGPMTRFALLQGGASLLGVQTLGLSVLILGIYGTDRDVGLLGIALALQTPATLFLGSIVNIWAPVVTDLHERGEMDRLESLYRTITRWVLTFSLPVFGGLIVVPELFVHLLAGSRGAGAASLVAILAAGNIFYAG
ncbi:MAG: oligosaccharide flippase family protein, partial [Actinomycetota bacterium]|nr:oligosaccharide flippase family protein [Actinomycetota bacterium]